MEYSNWPKGSLSELSNKALVNKATKGCPDSFGEIIHRDAEYIRGWLLKKTSDESLSEELLQITLIKCWSNIEKFKGESSFRTWACTIAKNLVIDNYRKTQRRAEFSLEHCQEGKDRLKFSKIDFDPLKKFKNEELKIFLNEVMEKLPVAHQNVLRHYAVGRLSYSEISKLEKCSIGTVMSRLFYARKKAQVLVRKHKNYQTLWD